MLAVSIICCCVTNYTWTIIFNFHRLCVDRGISSTHLHSFQWLPSAGSMAGDRRAQLAALMISERQFESWNDWDSWAPLSTQSFILDIFTNCQKHSKKMRSEEARYSVARAWEARNTTDNLIKASYKVIHNSRYRGVCSTSLCKKLKSGCGHI